MFFQIDGKCAFEPQLWYHQFLMEFGGTITFFNIMVHCRTLLQKVGVVHHYSYPSVQYVENYTLAQFDETICFFKLMENVRLIHRICDAYLLVLRAGTIGIVGDLRQYKKRVLGQTTTFLPLITNPIIFLSIIYITLIYLLKDALV